MSNRLPTAKRQSIHVCILAAFLFAAGQASAASPAAPLFSSALPMAGSEAGRPVIQVELNKAALTSAKPGQVLTLTLPGMGSQEVVFDASQVRGQSLQWLGHLKQGVQYSVLLTIDEQGAAGNIRTPQGSFRLGHANGSQWLVHQGMADVAAEIAALPAMFRGVSDMHAVATDKKPAKAAYPVSFDLVAMSSLKPGDDVALTIPGQGSHRVVYEETRAAESGSTTWVGYLKDYGNDFRVLVTSGPEGSVGNVNTPSGELELTMVDNQQWLVDRKASGLNSFTPDHSDAHLLPLSSVVHPVGGAVGAPAAAGASASTGTSVTPTVAAATVTPTNVVDLLVLTTPGFQTVRGTSWRLRIDQVVALANQAYIDSGVPNKVRLVGVEIINYADTNSNSTTLSSLAAGTAPFNTVAALRNTYGADLVTLIRPFYNTAQGGSCGVGYVLGSATNSISLYSSYAYSVVSDGNDTAGTGYYCTDYTLAHEMGHNMGSMHDRATVTAQGGGQGAYPYGYGYGLAGSFGTVMSYISPRIGKFSNPNDLTCGGKYACGVSETNTTSSANNALSLTKTTPLVAQFRASVVPDTRTVTGVVAKAGVAVAGVTIKPSTTTATCTTSGSTGAYSCTVPLDWSGTLTPSLTGATFSPASLSFTGVLLNQVNQNFAKN